MDDLIRRKAAIEVIRGVLNTSVGFTCGLEEMIAMVEAVPSVPAVPLDKLCEWLASFRAELPVAVACNYRGAKVCTDCDYMDRSLVDCWKRILTRWMEGLDGTD